MLLKAQEVVPVSASALGVLVALVRAEGAVLSRKELFGTPRPGRKFGFREIVDNRAVELRRALEENPEEPRWLGAVRGLGYRLVAA